MNNTLYIVIPCYNEEEVMRGSAYIVLEKLKTLVEREYISEKSRILFVNDGSKDSTWQIIEDLCRQDTKFNAISLSCNKGHQNALMAGLMIAKEHADMVVSMDADLQDDINAIDEMVKKYNKGYEIIYGVRSKRDTDSFFKRFTAEGFYKILSFLGADVVYNHADYRLMSKRALDALSEYNEVNLFLRGIVPMLGFKTDYVYYARGERAAGESKYPLKKMISFAWEGITSLSTTPIRIVTTSGITVFITSIIMMIYSLIRHAIGATNVGWSSLMISLWFIGGIVIISVGIVGEYIGKIYMETKKRPRYIVEKAHLSASDPEPPETEL